MCALFPVKFLFQISGGSGKPSWPWSCLLSFQIIPPKPPRGGLLGGNIGWNAANALFPVNICAQTSQKPLSSRLKTIQNNPKTWGKKTLVFPPLIWPTRTIHQSVNEPIKQVEFLFETHRPLREYIPSSGQDSNHCIPARTGPTSQLSRRILGCWSLHTVKHDNSRGACLVGREDSVQIKQFLRKPTSTESLTSEPKVPHPFSILPMCWTSSQLICVYCNLSTRRRHRFQG